MHIFILRMPMNIPGVCIAKEYNLLWVRRNHILYCVHDTKYDDEGNLDEEKMNGEAECYKIVINERRGKSEECKVLRERTNMKVVLNEMIENNKCLITMNKNLRDNILGVK